MTVGGYGLNEKAKPERKGFEPELFEKSPELVANDGHGESIRLCAVFPLGDNPID